MIDEVKTQNVEVVPATPTPMPVLPLIERGNGKRSTLLAQNATMMAFSPLNAYWEAVFTDYRDRGVNDCTEKGLFQTLEVEVASKWSPGVKYGHFYLSPMPGCCGVVVSHDTMLLPTYRGRVSTSDFHALKMAVAKVFGYTLMVSTIQTSNTPSYIGAMKNGWRSLQIFRNRRTSNDIAVCTKIVS